MTNAKSNVSGLTEKQEGFARQYVAPHVTNAYKTLLPEDLPFNGTRAVIRAGYSEKGASAAASRLLANVNVQQFMATLQKPVLERYEATHDELISKLNRMAMANIGNFMHRDEASGEAWIDVTKATHDELQVVGQFEVTELPPQKYVEDGEEVVREVIRTKIKLKDDWKPLEALLRHHKLCNIPDGEAASININSKIDTEDRVDIARRIAFTLREAAEIEKKQKKAAAAAPVAEKT